MSDYGSNNNEKQVEETVPTGVRMGCSQREFPTLKAHSITVWKKRAKTILLCQMDLSLCLPSVPEFHISYENSFLFVPLWKVSTLHL